MISLAAIPTDMLVFFLGSASFTELPRPAIGCHSPHACLSYISSTATVKPLIYGCLSRHHHHRPHPPTDGLWLFTQGEKGPKPMKYNKQEVIMGKLVVIAIYWSPEKWRLIHPC